MTIAFTCRLCARPGECLLSEAEANDLTSLDGGDRDLIENLVGSLCHHSCWEVWWTCWRIEAWLHRASNVLVADVYKETHAALRPKLEIQTRAWVANECRRFGLHGDYWTPDFPQLILDKPKDIGFFLRDFRRRLEGEKNG
jgi:hypothetical protein